MVETIIVISRRKLRRDYGEDRILQSFLDILKRKFTVIYSQFDKRNLLTDGLSSVIGASNDVVIILHHDVSFLSFYALLRRLSRKKIPVIGLVYFIDTYDPLIRLRCLGGWFLAQLFMYLVTGSFYVYRTLKRHFIYRVRLWPLLRFYRACSHPSHSYSSKGINRVVRVCYIGVVDSERFNPGVVARLVFKVHRELGVPLELTVVSRPSGGLMEKDCMVRSWLRVRVIRRLLSDEEKCRLLTESHVAVFSAKRIRFVVPPLFLVEAACHGCLIYAPFIADVLRNEGLNNVYDDLDKLVSALKGIMS